jgi:hypothetical protein
MALIPGRRMAKVTTSPRVSNFRVRDRPLGQQHVHEASGSAEQLLDGAEHSMHAVFSRYDTLHLLWC